MPLHNKLIALISELGYPADKDGMCYGYTMMGLQAMLADDLKTFENRRNLLESTLKKHTPEKLAALIKQIEAKRVQHINTLRDELLTQLNLATDMKTSDFYDLLASDKYKNDKRVITFYEKRKNVDQVLSTEEQQFTDVRAFLEGMTLYFSPTKFPQVFEQNAIPTIQDAALTLIRGLPFSLGELKEDKENKSSTESEASKTIKFLKEFPLVARKQKFIGMYNSEELYTYIELLKPDPPGVIPPICLLLRNGGHVISIAYDSKESCWILIDANRRIKRCSDLEIANTIKESFFNDEITIMKTEIFYHTHQEEYVNTWWAKIEKNDAWQNLHSTQGKEKLVDSNGVSFLYFVARDGDYDTLTTLLDNKANIHQTVNGVSPLYIAAQHGHWNIVQKLLELNALIDQTAPDNTTSLFIAAQDGHTKTVKILLEHKATINQKNSNYGLTSLLIAAQNGRLDIVTLLLEQKADANQATFDNGTTPLYAAVKKGHLKIVEKLLEYKANIDKAKWSDKTTPLYFAADNRQIKMVHDLLELKANPNQASDDGTSPFFIAILNGFAELIDPFIEKKADLSQPISPEIKILLKCVGSDNTLSFKKLLKDKQLHKNTFLNNFTPLHAAIFFKHTDIVKHLMAAKADINQKIDGCISCQELALALNHTEILSLLQKTTLSEKIEPKRDTLFSPKKDTTSKIEQNDPPIKKPPHC